MRGRSIILVRHGRTHSNLETVYAGRNAEPLTAEGAAEAERLAPSLAGRSIGAIFASPVPRAVQTAEILASPLDLPVSTEPGLTEIRMGPWKGLTEKEVEERFPEAFRLWLTMPSRVALEGRETLAEVQARSLAAMGRILSDGGPPVVLAVTHVAVIRCLVLHFQRRGLDDYKKIDVPNLSLRTVVFEDGTMEGGRLVQ
jgi:broad specificity phosphatase PhoE